jgi:hypothetical protein
MEFLRGLAAGKKCDRNAVLAYFNELSFDKQLGLLAKMSERLQNANMSGTVASGACTEDTVISFIKSLNTNDRLKFVLELISALKKVPNINNVPNNYIEPSNEELQAELNKLNALEKNTTGGKRKHRKSRKASRRHLTRRRR